jgi:UTP-glucose-1-phosphate uridylyltransferase
MNAPELLVLAAGIGSRYGGLKQIDPVGPSGETIIDYSIYDALRAGFGKLVFVIRRDLEASFRQTIGARFERRAAVQYVFQELDALPDGFHAPPTRVKPWGTGHAVLVGASAITGPFAAINADDFYGANSFRVLADHLRSGSPEDAMVGFILRQTLSEFGSVARGVCRAGPGGLLESISELTRIEKNGAAAQHTDAAGQVHPLTGDEIVSMNMWGFNPAIFDHLRRHFVEFLKKRGSEEKAEFFISTFINTLIASGQARLKVLPTADGWFGITYREDRPRVIESIRALIARGDYPAKLWT